MKTSRSDVKRDNKDTKCFEATLLGHSTYTLRKGDFFRYKEDRTFTRLARCHGRVKPLNVAGKEKKIWFVLAQAVDDMLTFTYELWIDPKDIMEVVPIEHADENIIEFFSGRDKGGE